VYDRAQAPSERAEALGAKVHASIGALADASEIVCASLPSRDACREAALTVAQHRGRTRYYVETSTVGSALLDEIGPPLERAGIALADAPVSGGPGGARAGALSIMLGAPPAVCEALRSTLTRISSNIFVIGETPGLGQKMKLINNLLSSAH